MPFFFAVPEISVDIRGSSRLILGQDYSFMCAVTIDNDIDSDIAYTLLHNNITTLLAVPFVLFEPLTLADAGIYQCMVEITSPYITGAVMMMAEQTVAFRCEFYDYTAQKRYTVFTLC